MSCDLIVRDCFGREVILEHSNWEKHLSRHPEVADYHDSFPLVLRDPNLVIEAAPGGQHHFYRQGIGAGRYHDFSLRLVVGEYAGVFKVATWWFTSELRTRGRVIYGPR